MSDASSLAIFLKREINSSIQLDSEKPVLVEVVEHSPTSTIFTIVMSHLVTNWTPPVSIGVMMQSVSDEYSQMVDTNGTAITNGSEIEGHASLF